MICLFRKIVVIYDLRRGPLAGGVLRSLEGRQQERKRPEEGPACGRSPEVSGRQAAKQITIPPGMGGRNVKR